MNSKIIYTLAFAEGVSVIMIELLGGKMMVPFFGSSFVVWTSTVGVTLLSLMLGYFLGARISRLPHSFHYLCSVLVITGVFLILLPDFSKLAIDSATTDNMYLGSVITSVKLLSVPLILLGLAPPVLVQLLTEDKEMSGNKAGNIFALSTLGGILCTLILGFFIIEKWGISLPLRWGGLSLCIVVGIVFYAQTKNKLLPLAGIATAVLLFIALNKPFDKRYFYYFSEGLQGQLRVFDMKLDNGNVIRTLQINGIDQTKANITQTLRGEGPPFSRFLYPHIMASIASSKPQGSDVLMLGYGGGSLSGEMINLGFDVEVVEIDERLFHVARDYFASPLPQENFVVDDARHYLKKNSKKYDIIIIDLLSGEVQPNHVITLEGLQDIKNSLKRDGLLLLNYQALKTEFDKAVLAIWKTLTDSGMDVMIAEGEDKVADYIFVCAPEPLQESKLFSYQRLNFCCKGTMDANPEMFGGFKRVEGEHSNIDALEDNYPCLEVLNAKSLKAWRNISNEQNKALFGQ